MNTEDFEIAIRAQIARCTDVLIQKAAEYASDVDRLHNFKVAAKLQGITVKEALAGMMAKHTTSVYDMVASGQDYSVGMWNEKIGDHINYLLLLRAIIDEERAALFERAGASKDPEGDNFLEVQAAHISNSLKHTAKIQP